MNKFERKFDKFDKPYRIIPTLDQNNVISMFSLLNTSKNVEEVLHFSIKNLIPLDTPDIDGNSLIHHIINFDESATESTKLNLIKFLVQNNVNPDRPNKNNITPLHLACKNQEYEIIKYLCENNVNTNFLDNLGNTPFHYLLYGKMTNIDNISPAFYYQSANINVNNIEREELIKDIKKNLWELINEQNNMVGGNNSYEDQENNNRNIIPLLKTLDNTIDNIIEDKDITSEVTGSKINYLNKISDILKKYDPNNLADLKTSIDMLKNDLINTIRNDIFKMSRIDELAIHKKEDLSWSHNTSYDTHYIKNGLLKQQIKKNIKDNINEINTIKLNIQNNKLYEDSLKNSTNLKDFIDNINDLDNNEFNDSFPNIKKECDTQIKNSVFGFFDFENKKYMANLNNLIIEDSYDIKENLEELGRKTNILHKYLYLLCVPSTIFINFTITNENGNNIKLDNLDNLNNTSYLINIDSNSFDDNWYQIYRSPDNDKIFIDYLQLALSKLYFTNNTYQSDTDFYKNWRSSSLNTTEWLLNMFGDLIDTMKHNMGIDDNDYFIFIRLLLFISGLQMNPEDNIKEFIVMCNSNIIDDYQEYIRKIFNNGDSIINNLDSELKELANRINDFSVMTHDDIKKLCEDIITYYEKIPNKPLQQTVNDLLYFIQSKNIIGYKNINDIKLIATEVISQRANNIDIDKIQNELSFCRQSSFYSFINDIIDKNNSNHKVKFAHYLGLYYQGQCINYNVTDNKIDESLIYCLSIYRKNIIYTKIIIDCYDEIINILTNMMKNDSTKLKYVYTKFYPIIVNCNIILNKLNNDDSKNIYNDLANNLNKINSNIYIYYYLFTPSKLIKLSRFNYFQINSNIENKYAYFEENKENITFDISGNTDSENKIDEMEFKKGYNNYSLNYGNLTYYYTINNYLQRLKESSLPPSLYENLDDFYKYVVIITIKKIIYNIDTDSSDKYKKLKDKILKYVTTSYHNIDDDMKLTIGYHNISKIIEELISKYITDKINININININKKISNEMQMKNNDIPNDFYNYINKIPEINFNIDIYNITNDDLDEYINLNKIIKPKEEDNCKFYWFINNLSNDSLLKKNTCIYINTDIIITLLNNKANPYINNYDNMNIINQLIKFYNYNPIEILKNNNILFNTNNQIKNQIKKEIINNMNKVLLCKKNNINELFNNINGSLYNNIKLLIKANESFGNNILYNLENSFHISSYLMLQYLSENLININSINNDGDLNKIFKLIKIDINKINKNYIYENIRIYQINQELKYIILKELKDKMISEKQNLMNKKSTVKTTFNRIKQDYNSDINNKINNIDNNIKKIKLNKIFLRTNDFTTTDNKDIIDRYEQNNNKKKNNVLLYAWDKLFKNKYDDNYNLSIILLLKEQSNLFINDKNIFDSSEILFGMKQPHDIGLEYFTNDKFTDENKTLDFINKMLIYNTKLVFGNSIESIMRKILYEYFNVNLQSDNINSKIDLILKNKINNNSDLIDILYDYVCPQLVLNSIQIHKNINHMKQHVNIDVIEILTNYFDLLNNSAIKLDNNIINLFKKDVVNYFSIFISKTIMYWHVNCENILKYFINNYRSLKTLECLSK